MGHLRAEGNIMNALVIRDKKDFYFALEKCGILDLILETWAMTTFCLPGCKFYLLSTTISWSLL